MKSKFLLRITFVLCIFLSLSLSVHSQANGDPQDPNKDHPFDNGNGQNTGTNGLGQQQQHAPFDGGLTLLIGTGVAYGIKKAYDKRKKYKDIANEEKIF
jgi:hypothetical protein